MAGDEYVIRRGGVIEHGVFMSAGAQIIRVTSGELTIRTAIDTIHTFPADGGWILVQHVRAEESWFVLGDGEGMAGPVAFSVPDPVGFSAAAERLGWRTERRNLPWWWWMSRCWRFPTTSCRTRWRSSTPPATPV